MTPEAQRIAIAEWCGWSDCHVSFARGYSVGYAPGEKDLGYRAFPDYLNDLNAIHEVESSHVEPHFVEEYAEQLYMVVERFWTVDRWLKFSRMGINYALAHATAAQRSEALLRTIGRWTDTKEAGVK